MTIGLIYVHIVTMHSSRLCDITEITALPSDREHKLTRVVKGELHSGREDAKESQNVVV